MATRISLSTITGAVDEVLSFVFIGANYASDIAKKTGKSIPVVFKQLDHLLMTGIISKLREGKKVVYVPNWKMISAVIATQLVREFTTYYNYLRSADAQAIPDSALREIREQMKGVPETLVLNGKALDQLLQTFFSLQETRNLFTQFVASVFQLSLSVSRALGFHAMIDAFLDVLGMLSGSSHAHVLSKDVQQNKTTVQVLQICRLRRLLKSAVNPSVVFLQSLAKQPA